jgi:hypothetical protein
MQQERFDKLAKCLAANQLSRKQVLKGLAASLLLAEPIGAALARPASAQGSTGEVVTADQVHLAWVGDPYATLTVVWRTLNTATPSTVQYRAASSTTWLEASGVQRTSGTSGKLHEATLSGLSPSTSYEYRVQGDGGTWSEVFSTRTAPPPGPAADFDVIYFADTGLVGREDGLATGTQQVVDEIAAINPLLVLPGGDYAYYSNDKRYGTLENTIDAWFNQVQPIASRSPMMPTYGNHDIYLQEGYEPWANRFPTPEGWNGRRMYSFDIGDVHFISVMAIQEDLPLSDSKISWLKNDIAAAKAAGRRWIIPYMHVSAFGDGTNHPSNLALRGQLGPIFESNGIKLVLSSHDQAYERTYPLTDIGETDTPTSTSKDCYEMSEGVTWVKVSPGGKLSNKSKGFSPFATDPPPVWTAYRNNTTHVFSRLSVRASGSVRVDTYGVKGDGTPPVIIDTFRYTTGGCQDDTAAPTVTTVAPTEGATGVSVSTNVAATFSEKMKATTIDGTTFTLVKDGTTTPVAVTVIYGAENKKAILDPDANLDEGATYIATVKGGTGGVKDLAGNALAADKTWSFTTTAPQTVTVTEVSPPDGATGVSRGTNVSAKFSKGMTPSTLNNSTFQLYQRQRFRKKKRKKKRWVFRWVPVSANVSYDAATKTATLDTSSDLVANSYHRAVVTTGSKDEEGNALAQNYSWTFTTGST